MSQQIIFYTAFKDVFVAKNFQHIDISAENPTT